VIDTVVDTVDTPNQRAAVSRAVINLRDASKLSDRHAAAAIIDLESRSQALIRGSLINAPSSRPANSEPQERLHARQIALAASPRQLRVA
jgi:hypothetical protein